MSPRKKIVLSCDPSKDRTQQSFKSECDLNNIVKRIQQSGFVPLNYQESFRRQVYGDFSGVPASLEVAYQMVQNASDFFAGLPASLRARWSGPGALVAWLDDPKNLEEAQTLGLVAKPAPKPGSADSPAPREASASVKPPDAVSTPKAAGEASK